jgi:anti-anti-sigma factor
MEIVEKKREDDIVVLRVGGRCDPTTVGDLQQCLDQVIEAGATKVILDLAALQYISSAGLRGLLMAAKKLKDRGGALAVCAAQRYVKEVLDIAGFSSIIPTFDDEQQAVAALG